MGCCQSNASHDEARNARPANRNLQDQAASPQGANRPNRRIRSPSPLARSPRDVTSQQPPWTRTHLERQRQVFFETRTSGRDEIWAALMQASESLVAGDLDAAQAILDAAGVTCPTGRFARGRGRNRARGGLYDERGMLYDIPNWVVTDPQDVVEDAEDKNAAADGAGETDEDDEAARRREEKGKGRAKDLGEEKTVRIRIHDGGPDVNIVFGAKQNASVVVKKVLEQHGKNIKMIFQGKKIDEQQTLESQGWQPGIIMNAYIIASPLQVEEGQCYERYN